jgi:hypothetical protein
MLFDEATGIPVLLTTARNNHRVFAWDTAAFLACTATYRILTL